MLLPMALFHSVLWLSSIPVYWRRQWHPTPVLLPGKSHGRRSLEGCSPWGCWGSDTTERLPFHFSLSCIGEGNGNPLQYSCLENPRGRGAWWAAVYGVAQSRTRLKWLSSSMGSFPLPWGHKESDTTERLALSRIMVQWSEVIGYRSQVRCLTEWEHLKWVKGQKSGVTCWEWKAISQES